MSRKHVVIDDLSYAIVEEGFGPPLILLHGFTGSARAWEPIVAGMRDRYRCIAIDLPGHGDTEAPPTLEGFRFSRVVADLAQIATALTLPKAAWLGYSMGGRLALGVAATRPELVATLILESASPGLPDAASRAARQTADGAMASAIERDGIPSFVSTWERLPMWASQETMSRAAIERQRAVRLANCPAGLAGALRGMGTGAQPSYWGSLAAFTMPTLLVTGKLDEKFTHVAQEMHAKLPNSRLCCVSGVGHAVHLEAPDRYISQIAAFLDESVKPQHVNLGGSQ